MTREARKGDMALVVGFESFPQMVGKIVHVTSDPTLEFSDGKRHENFGFSPEGATCLKTGAGSTGRPCNRYTYGAINWLIRTSNLVPLLDPDSEQATERERELAR